MIKQIFQNVSLFVLLTFTFSLSTVVAQSPNAFSYQAVARASNGDLITNKAVSFRISLLQGSTSGSVVYTETHAATTNKYGLVNLSVGNGSTSDNFSDINWANGPYFIKIEMDAAGGSSYAHMGTSQLLSVPYALYAETAGNSNIVLKDTSATKELQMLSISNGTIYLDKGGYVVLPDTAAYALIATSSKTATFSDSSNKAKIANTAILADFATKANIANTATTFNRLTSKGSEPCNASNEGLMRYNATSKEVEYCNGSNWNTLVSVSAPTLITTAVSSINISSALTSSLVSYSGGAEIIEKGVCWSISGMPTISSDTTMQGAGSVAYNSNLTDLTSNELYYVRSYATNTAGTGFGNELSFTTLANVSATVQGLDLYAAPASFSTGGTVDVGGGESVTERGVVYGSSANPTKANSFVAASTAGTGSFSVTISGLAAGKVYYRAYAVNAGGISYGPEYSTNVYGAGTGVTDYDGNTYGSVIIGSQEWMTSNLEVTHYSDGTAIPLVTDNNAWGNLGYDNPDKGYCWYNNDTAINKDLYGALYTYVAATNGNNSGANVQGVCPTGWHLPSDAEWTALTNALGGSIVAGGKLKATSGWNSGGNGTDIIGFAALPGGFRELIDGSFKNAGSYANWWSSNEYDASRSWKRNMRYNNAELYSVVNFKSNGFSVRCLRN